MCMPTTPLNLAPRIEALAAAMARVPRGLAVDGRHDIGLRLAGALLLRGVDPAAVPAACYDIAAGAGWDAAHHRRSAEDTVAKHASGQPVRSDLPPSLVPALDAFCSTVSAPAPDLREQQRRLRSAIGEVPRGRVRLVRAPCGIGKTHTTILVSQTQPVVVSTPTNELAEQVTADMRAAGGSARRLYGPASHPACRYQRQAKAIAEGGLSVRVELCEGRGVARCPYYEGCAAREGKEGEGSSTVGNHGLLGSLAAVAGAKRTLVIDEPPATIVDTRLTAEDLKHTLAELSSFEDATVAAMLPLLQQALGLLKNGPLNEPQQLRNEDAAALRRVVPHRERVLAARSHFPVARRLGEAAAVLRLLRQAISQADARVTVVEHWQTGRRQLAITALHPQLAGAVRREGKTVVMAADVELYASSYARLLGYEPELVQLQAPDGCAVRRVLVRTKAASRSNWIVRGNFPAKTLEYALSLARETGPAVGVVTFKGLKKEVSRRYPDIPVKHYKALRGLNGWKDFDAVITLGDPRMPADVAERMGINVDSAARAELEQAHGRLRVVHRTRSAAMIHVGSLVPMGWRDPIEVLQAPVGRPKRERESSLVKGFISHFSSKRAAARAAGVSHPSLLRWARGEGAPSMEVVELMRSLNRQFRGTEGSDVSGTETPM